MKLQGYKVGGKTLGKDIFSCTDAELNGNPAYKISEIVSSDYGDITSLDNIMKYCNRTSSDYKVIRKMLQAYGNVSDTVWSTYTPSQKIYICSMKATDSLSRRIAVLGSDHDSLMSQFNLDSQDCRQKRFSNAFAMLMNNISPISAFQINIILEADKLDYNYIYKGIEGTMEDNPDIIEGLFNFVEATPLSAYHGETHDPLGNLLGKYENTGVAAMNIVMLPESTLTKAQLVAKFMDCLRNGIY